MSDTGIWDDREHPASVKLRDLQRENERLRGERLYIAETLYGEMHAEIERLRRVEQAAERAYRYLMLGYESDDDFDVDIQLDLMNELRRALDEGLPTADDVRGILKPAAIRKGE